MRSTGSVTVLARGMELCSGALDAAGNSACNFQFPAGFVAPARSAFYPGVGLVANYTDDANYAAQSSARGSLAALALAMTDPTELAVGGTARFVAEAVDAYVGIPIVTRANLHWISSNAAVATVNGGTVSALAAGVATITASDPATLASAAITVTVSQ